VKRKKAAAKPRAKKSAVARTSARKPKARGSAIGRADKYDQPGAPWWKVYLTGGDGAPRGSRR
jgi:hypothetical protein